MLAERVCDVVVVGGGVGGLVSAWELRDLDVLVLEKAARVGGRVESEARGDYWLNLAAHLFPGAASALGRIVSEVGLETVPVRGSTMAVWSRGSLVRSGPTLSYPVRLSLPAGARLSLFRTGARLRRDVRAYRELARQQPGEAAAAVRSRLLGFLDDRTFAEHLGPLHPDADAIVRAATRRVGAEPEELSAGAGVTQFAATFSGSSSQFQRNLPGGSSRLPERLSERLGDRVQTGCEVTQVRETPSGVELEYVAGGSARTVRARAAIVAAPAPVARKIVAGLPPSTAAALDAIAYGPYTVAGIVTKETQVVPWDSVYALVAASLSFNMLFNVVSSRRTAARREPGGSLMVYGASALARELDGLTDSEVERRFLRDLNRVFPQTQGIVDEVVIRRWEAGLPSARPGRHAHQAALETPIGNVRLVGDYIGERAGMDATAQIATEAAAWARSHTSRSFGRPA